MNLVENATAFDPIEKLIAACKFTPHDVDYATTGYCGTFALALYRILKKRQINAQLVLVCRKDMNGFPYVDPKDPQGGPYWCHVAVRVDGKYYDVYGKQTPEAMYKEFCWGLNMPGMDTTPDSGIMMDVSEEHLIILLRKVRNSYNHSHLQRWKSRLDRN